MPKWGNKWPKMITFISGRSIQVSWQGPFFSSLVVFGWILKGASVKTHSLQSGETFKKMLLRSIWWLHRLLLVLRSRNHRSDLDFDMKMIEFWRSMCENRILVPETYIKDKMSMYFGKYPCFVSRMTCILASAHRIGGYCGISQWDSD